MIGEEERRRFLAVPMCGERVVARLEAAGIERLSDLCGRDPWELLEQVNIAAGHVIWRPPVAITALEHLVAAADGIRTENLTRSSALSGRLPPPPTQDRARA